MRPGCWGKSHLGCDPERRSPVDFGFDEAVWSPRTADEVLWTMQSYFPDGPVTATPYAGDSQLPLEPELIYRRRKGAKAEVLATYDAEFRAGFDRQITDWAIAFMRRAHEAGRPFYVYLPYTQVHIPPSPARSSRARPGWATWPTCWSSWTTSPAASWTPWTSSRLPRTPSWSGPLTTAPTPTAACRPVTPTPSGASGPGSRDPGGAGTSLPGGLQPNSCLIRWPNKVPAGKVSNQLVHLVDLFTTLVLARGGQVPADRQVDGMDMRAFLLGDAEESGRDTVLCLQGNRLQAINWRQWKAAPVPAGRQPLHLRPLQHPHLHNLEWDPREEHQVDFPTAGPSTR